MSFLSVKNLAKNYATKAEVLSVLRDISFEIKEGSSLSVIGESGTGKSTLLNLIGGLDYASEGSIALLGERIEALDESALAAFRNRHIGFVFQYHHLLPDFTALENALLPAMISGQSRKQAEAAATVLLEAVGLAGRLHHRPFQLSGGEQQRVAIARALVNSPRLVLLDEPTGNLDENTEKSVLDTIFKLQKKQKLTLIMVTHSLEIAGRTGRCLRLHGGYGEFISR